jgi:hypothetical protein
LGLFLCFILCGCITDFEPKGIEEQSSILVVEGIITDDETIITLSRSEKLIDMEEDSYSYYIDNARVYVECDDGTQFHANSWEWSWNSRNGRYTINTGNLDMNHKYSLNIMLEEIDKTYEYSSEFSYPIPTPEIDSVFWTKNGKGQRVMIHVATHSPYNEILYYRWWYKEDWEIVSEHQLYGISCPICHTYAYGAEVCRICGTVIQYYPYYCWSSAINRDMLLGSAEKTVFGQLTYIITEMPATSRRLSELYRIDVRQNAISKRSYDYFVNIRKNSEKSGNIFSPTPSELRGNIKCITDPGKPVIGYVDVSTTTHNRRYISRAEDAYEHPLSECEILTREELCAKFGYEDCGKFQIPNDWIVYDRLSTPLTYIEIKCVDCTYFGDTTNKPEDWPKDH